MSAIENTKEVELGLEKMKICLDFVKWVIGSVAIVIATAIINNGFKERSAGVQEMQAFDRYVEVILKADNIEGRWKLSEFFSIVTPTERLRNKWISYNKLIKPDYDTFKTLKKDELSIREKPASPEAIVKLNKIKNQLAPFETKLSNIGENNQSINSLIAQNSNAASVEPEFLVFKEKVKRNPHNVIHSKLQEYFEKSKQVNDSTVMSILKEVGEQFNLIQTGINFNYKESIFSNQVGIFSKYDDSKKIWPVFQARFVNGSVTVTLTEGNNPPEVYNTSIDNNTWNDMGKFIRKYYIKRLNQLNE